MLTETDNTFGKREHLCKQTLIDQLFSGKAHAMTAWPLKMVYLVVDKTDEQSASVELMVSVSKRFFKRAVKRNRVKRQIREAYRTQKHELMSVWHRCPTSNCCLPSSGRMANCTIRLS